MQLDKKRITFADASQTERRAVEVRTLINVIQPNPIWQPGFISDETTLDHMCDLEPAIVQSRLEHYFGRRLPAPLSTTVWEFIDALKQEIPKWPESEPFKQ